MSLPTLNLGKNLESALLSRHPWIYRNHVGNPSLRQGDWVRLEAGQASAIGIYDATSAVAIRIFTHDNTIPDKAFIHERVKQALALRNLVPADTDCYRLLYGEGDYLPGIVADKYGRHVIIKTYANSVESLLPDVVTALSKQLKLRGVAWRTPAGLESLWGELPPPEVTVREHGLKFIANLYEGQKTGLFLDQRENRQFIRSVSDTKSVLNLFSYNGGFSVYALAGGAKHVTSVDIAPAANEDAMRNAHMNNVADKHTAVTADVFAFLADKRREQFDMVILDPPSLAKDKQSKFAALRAYKKLNTLALACVKPGGLLISSSCTSQVSSTDFKSMLGDATVAAKRQAQIVHEAGHPVDHPVPTTFSEGRYLKFVAMRVL